MTPTRLEYATLTRRAVITRYAARGAWTVQCESWGRASWRPVRVSDPLPRKAAERLAVAWCEEGNDAE